MGCSRGVSAPEAPREATPLELSTAIAVRIFGLSQQGQPICRKLGTREARSYDGRMRSISALTLASALLFVPRLAAAQAESGAGGSEATGLGVGIQAMQGTASVPVALGPGVTEEFSLGVAGPAVTYQTPQFHIDGILNFYAPDGFTTIGAGGRFFYELHSTQASDLSIGGGLGFYHISVDSPGDDYSETLLQFEVGAKIRAFLAPSVALNASVGLGLISGDFDHNSFTGQILGGIGLTYFFF